MNSAAVPGQGGGMLAFGPFRFDIGNGLLYRDGAEVPLAPRAIAVLQYLAERPSQVVSRQALMDAVWKDTFVEDASLKEAISRLRQALDDDPQQPRYIQTVHRRGYRFLPAGSPSNGASPAAEADAAAKVPGRPVLIPRRAALPIAATVIGLVVGAVAARTWPVRAARPEPAPLRFSVMLPPGYVIASDAPSAMAFSPDGHRLALVAQREAGEETALFIRDLDRLETRAVAGGQGASGPFFSPDGETVGFYAYGMLKRVPALGGTPADICQVPTADFLGADWGRNGTVVFGTSMGLMRVAAAGGTPALVTRADHQRGEIGHWWPHFLPDGDHVLFTAWTNGLDRARVDLASVERGDRRPLVAGASDARYSDGHLIVSKSGGPAAVAFDLGAMRVSGDTVPIDIPVRSNPFFGVMGLAASPAGAIAYAPGTSAFPETRLMWLGSDGAPQPSTLHSHSFRNARLSPDGRRVAVTISQPSNYDLWVGDLDRGTLMRLTFAGRNIEPVWSPDGVWIAFASSVTTPFAVVRRRADGSGSVETLFSDRYEAVPTSWSPDGRTLLIERFDPENRFDLWTLSLDRPGTPVPLVRTRFQEMAGAFSPDGRWVLYESDESGSNEVYVRPYPAPDGRWQISAGIGGTPFWSRDGRTIHYTAGSQLMAVPFRSGLPPDIGRAHVVDGSAGVEWRSASPDGRVVGVEQDQPRPQRIDVATSWRSPARR